MMEFLLGLAGAAAIYAVILVNKWQVLRVIKREIKRVEVLVGHDAAGRMYDVDTRLKPICKAIGRANDAIDALPAFGVCAICGATGFADCMTKMTAREYANLRGKTGDPNEFLMEDYRVHIHDECLRRAGYVHEYGVVAGWRKCPTVESKVFEKDSPKKGKG